MTVVSWSGLWLSINTAWKEVFHDVIDNLIKFLIYVRVFTRIPLYQRTEIFVERGRITMFKKLCYPFVKVNMERFIAKVRFKKFKIVYRQHCQGHNFQVIL